jgi:hypothetical protein
MDIINTAKKNTTLFCTGLKTLLVDCDLQHNEKISCVEIVQTFIV